MLCSVGIDYYSGELIIPEHGDDLNPLLIWNTKNIERNNYDPQELFGY